MIILLTGMRAAGKTTLGRAAAASLGMHFIDLDDLVREAFDNQTVADIWRLHGERAWRDEEARQLKIALAQHSGLLGVGGGGVLDLTSRVLIDQARSANRVRVLYLECDPAVLATRLAADSSDRPSLTGRPLDAEVEEILARRKAIYEQLADATLNTSKGVPESLSAELALLVRSLLTGRPDACCS